MKLLESLSEYKHHFGETFPYVQLKGYGADKLIEMIKKCIEEDDPIDEFIEWDNTLDY